MPRSSIAPNQILPGQPEPLEVTSDHQSRKSDDRPQSIPGSPTRLYPLVKKLERLNHLDKAATLYRFRSIYQDGGCIYGLYFDNGTEGYFPNQSAAHEYYREINSLGKKVEPSEVPQAS